MTEAARSKPARTKKPKKVAKSAVAVPVPARTEMPGQLFSLPVLGPTTAEDVTFYGVLGIVTVAELIAWPTAALFGTVHALHQRARNLTMHGHERGELIEGTMEATEGLL